MPSPSFNLLLFLSVILSGVILISRLPFSKYIAILPFLFFLVVAPPTAEDQDFDAYKTAFENIEIIGEYPFVITTSVLTSERAYYWYMAPFSFVTSQFNYYLALNFLFLCLLATLAFKKLNFTPFDLRSVMIFSFPALIPIIFYWSPRSGPSLVLILFSFGFLKNEKVFFGLLFAFVATLIHSQYIPFITVLVATMLVSSEKKLLFYATLFSLATLIFLKHGAGLIRLLPIPDIFTVALYKLHYIEEIGFSRGVRPAGLGVIVICVLYLVVFRNRLNVVGEYCQTKVLLDICVVFSLIANVLFIQDSHIAGRIARFSDFFIIVVGVSYVVSHVFSRKYVMLVSAASFIMLLIFYNNIYYIEI